MYFEVRVLGCKVNQYEAEQIRHLLMDHGTHPVPYGGSPDMTVVHSCAVTAEAARKTRRLCRHIKKKYPQTKLILTGCGAAHSVSGKDIQDIISIEPGSGWLERLETVIDTILKDTHLDRDLSDDHLLIHRFSGHHRAFLKIQDGCDIGCSYCIVPSLRGTPRDKPMSLILDEARLLVSEGYQEIVIVGVNVGQYGKYSNGNLAQVLKQFRDLSGLVRIRMSSLHPAELTDELLDVWAESGNIMPHIHLPLQSGSGRILSLMNRGYTRDEFSKAVQCVKQRLDRPAFNTDIIVGFPGETDADFNDTLSMVREVGFSRVHAFPYSPRSGVAAVDFPGIVDDTRIKERLAILRSVAEEQRQIYYRQFMGQTLEVLFESFNKQAHSNSGYSERYIHVLCKNGEDLSGCIRQVVIEGCNEGHLAGAIVN